MAKILVTALYDNVKNGGSGGYMNCLIQALKMNKHDVKYSNTPAGLNPKDFDLCISSHRPQLSQIANWNLPKVHIMQGFVPQAEHPIPGATHYVSISPEVQAFARAQGYESTVVRQPIFIPGKFKPAVSKDILFIKNSATKDINWNINKLKLSNLKIPINTQISRSKMSITLGRGALETMAIGRPVIIADNRFYQGLIGDGYVTPENFLEIEKNNFSGRRFRNQATQGWIDSELSKYRVGDGKQLREMIIEYNEATKIAKQLVDLA
tara:strand:+ start:270 stop:1067 length:798 start_codon:yes stop_codon:yes gene_type:complete